VSTEATPQVNNNTGLLELLSQIQSQYGVVVLVLVVIIAFACLLFWRLVWKVWSEALKAKDDEIRRLAKERDKYQALFFQRLRTSEALLAKADRESSDDYEDAKSSEWTE
jgi:F0F1-type ATP synthase membrane subunit b/b'